jgi:hypothetical protein
MNKPKEGIVESAFNWKSSVSRNMFIISFVVGLILIIAVVFVLRTAIRYLAGLIEFGLSSWALVLIAIIMLLILTYLVNGGYYSYDRFRK